MNLSIIQSTRVERNILECLLFCFPVTKFPPVFPSRILGLSRKSASPKIRRISVRFDLKRKRNRKKQENEENFCKYNLLFVS